MAQKLVISTVRTRIEPNYHGMKLKLKISITHKVAVVIDCEKLMQKTPDGLMKRLRWERSHGQPQMNNYQLATYFSNIFNVLYANMGNFNP